MEENGQSQKMENGGEPMEQGKNGPATEENKTAPAENPEEGKEGEKKPEKKKPKKSSKTTDLKVNVKQHSCRSPEELNVLVEVENELIAQVKLEKERVDAKNAVEEYVYGMREKIYDQYEHHLTDDVREQFSSLLTKTEDWLYEEGEDEEKSVYVAKLAELRKVGQPIVDRYHAHNSLPSVLEELGASLLHFRKIIDLYTQDDEKYNHIETEEMKKVEKKVEEKFKWFNEKTQQYNNCPKYMDAPVLPTEVQSEKKILETFCNPIVNKAKPKPKEEPPKDESKDKSEENNASSDKTAPPPPASNETMDTDQKDQNGSDAPKVDLTMEVD